MCKVHNSIGCLTAIKSHLRQHNIDDFKSLNEVIKFQKNYPVLQQQIISNHQAIIEAEKISLSSEIAEVENSIQAEKDFFETKLLEETEQIHIQLNHLSTSTPTSFIQSITFSLKLWWYQFNLWFKSLISKYKIESAIRNLVKELNEKNNRYQYIQEHFKQAVYESYSLPLKELKRKKDVIEEINSSIYGALGEMKVVKELEKLSDEYILINDFSVSFNKAIYHKKEDEHILSIQIDHILVAPSGIFLIETKNWSEVSLNNPDLRSPVKQIKRNSFALYRMIAGETEYSKLRLSNHFWGSKKIPTRNLVVFTNSKPKEEFQFAKLLTINELLGYIKYFEPVLSTEETQKIADYLLST